MYDYYMTKKRAKFISCTGIEVNIPALTICPRWENYVIYPNPKKETEEDKDYIALCTLTSQNFIDYFWFYDPNRPDGGKEQQKLYDELAEHNPLFYEEYRNEEAMDVWLKYGELEDRGVGYKFNWNESLKDGPTFIMKNLLNCIKNRTLPNT